MINLFDFNNLSVRCFFAGEVNAKNDPNIDLWRYFVIKNIYYSLFKGDIDEVILACDGKDLWRKTYWKRYKETRESKREKSGIDWKLYYSEHNRLLSDIKKFFPFKVLKINRVEADDIIAVISKNKNCPITIISTDEDFLQLSSERVKIFNPLKQDFVFCEDTEQFVIEKCFIGQSKDDIFNIKTPIDWPLGKRKPGFGKKAFQKVMLEGYEKWLKRNKLEKRFEINRNLIDFNKIPPIIVKSIISHYNNYVLPEPEMSYKFFKQNNWKEFLDRFYKDEHKMLNLYSSQKITETSGNELWAKSYNNYVE